MFGKNFKFYRLKKGLTQEQIGKELNCAKSTINSWENNRSQPDLDMLIKIANYFQISIDILLGTGLSESNDDNFVVLQNILRANGYLNKDDYLSKNDFEMLMKQFEIYKQYKNKDN